MLPFVLCLSGCDTTNFFFGVGKASFLNTVVSPTFASKMVSVTEQIKDAEGKLSVTCLENFTTYQNSWSL